MKQKQQKLLRAAFITWMFIFTACVQILGVQAANLGTSVSYDERTINVTTSNGDNVVKYSFDNQAWIYAIKTSSGWVIDISSLSEAKKSSIYIIGNKSTDVTTFLLNPITAYSGKLAYSGIDIDTKKAHSINVETEKKFEYRTTVNASWKLSTALAGDQKVIPVNSLEIYGGTIYVRDAGYTSGSGANIEYTRPSKIKSVKVPKSANVPNVKLNALTGYVTGINVKTMELRVENSTGVVNLATVFGGDNYTLSYEAGWYKTTLTTLDVGRLAEADKITVYVRTFATASAPSSKEKEFELNKQASKPNCAVANTTTSSTQVVLSYVDQVVIVDSINKYEYTIVPTGSAISNTTKWITLSKNTTSLESAVTALKKDSTIHFRIKGVNSTKTTPTAILASAAESYPCNMRPALKTFSYDSATQSINNSNTGAAIEYTTNKSKWSSGATIKLPTANDYSKFNVANILLDTKSFPLYLRIAASNENKTFPSVVKTVTMPKLTTALKFKFAMAEMLEDGVPRAGTLILSKLPNLEKGLNKALNGSESNNAGAIKIGYNIINKGGATASITPGPNSYQKTNAITYSVYYKSWNAAAIIAGNKDSKGDVDRVSVHESMHAIMCIATSNGMLGSSSFPSWFIEGTAQMAGGVTGWAYSLDTSNQDAFKKSFAQNFTKGTSVDNYCMGYYATSYLSYIAGGGTINNLTSISGTAFNSTVQTGLNNIFGNIIGGSSLSTAMATQTSNKEIKFNDFNDFVAKLKVCDENFYKFCKKLQELQGTSGAGSILTASPDVKHVDILNNVNKSTRFDIDTTTKAYLNVLNTFWIGGGTLETAAYQGEVIGAEEIID